MFVHEFPVQVLQEQLSGLMVEDQGKHGLTMLELALNADILVCVGLMRPQPNHI